MTRTYNTIVSECTQEIVEKKSRFIAHIAPVKTVEEAEAFFERIQKKHYDARHNCIAYSIGANQPQRRCSDDGEPSGTAGNPMLEVLSGANLTNVAAVVTRYFGGTLLGTGGLVRAYTNAMKQAVNACEQITYHLGRRIEIVCDYMAVGKLQYVLEQNEILQLEANYGENVEFVLMIPEDKVDDILNQIVELTSGKAKIKKGDQRYFSLEKCKEKLC